MSDRSSAPRPPRPASDDPRPLTIAELERWTDFGASWRPVEIAEDSAVVDLCQCTGELVERRCTTDPEVIAYLRRQAGGQAGADR
jgi:hypothetical protein